MYENVLTLDNNNTTALNDLGHLNLILGNKIEAKKLFEKVIKLDEQHVRAFKNYFLITKVDNNNEYFKKFSKVNFYLHELSGAKPVLSVARSYPFKENYTHVLGYVRQPN